MISLNTAGQMAERSTIDELIDAIGALRAENNDPWLDIEGAGHDQLAARLARNRQLMDALRRACHERPAQTHRALTTIIENDADINALSRQLARELAG